MCGRYTTNLPPEVFEALEITNKEFELHASYNVAPGQSMPVVVAHSPKQFETMKWGLIPFWAKDPKIAYSTINARCEDISSKPAFRAPLKNRRCLIPASGFYEWEKLDAKHKQPYYFRLKSREWFCFAGLYDVWKDASGYEVKSYTIITTAANSVVERVHGRMPVILKASDYDTWADNSSYSPELLELLKPYPAHDMVAYPISAAVNSPRNNRPDLIAELKNSA